MTNQYAHAEMLVTTEWVDENRSDSAILRIVESNEDILLYGTGHVPEAVHIDWVNDLQDQLVRDYIDHNAFSRLCEKHGINNDTTVVFYGDKSNWWACYAMWVFKLFGHDKCRIMDGGRQKWAEENRPMSTDKPSYPTGGYEAEPQDLAIRAFRDDVEQQLKISGPLVDVRSAGEYRGELLHMPDYPQEGALRGGHIPGAASVPWATAVNADATFKSREELEEIYLHQQSLKHDDDVIVYCRIGERSSHTWFVLTYLLGFTKVRNYDGSWTEWGNCVGLPIEKETPAAVAVS